MKDVSWFISVCSDNGLEISRGQAVLFEKYRELLLNWNRQINLVSRRDEENFYPNHALNSISFLFTRSLKGDSRVIDLGTGGGLPGVPLKVLEPGLNLWLLDSIAKKTAALSSILADLGLPDARAVTGRAEELAKTDEFKGHFDYVVSRAAGKLDDLAKWSRGFLKRTEAFGGKTIPVGTLIVLKGGDFADEVKHTRNLKFVESVAVDEITFNGMDEMNNRDKKLVLVEYKSAGVSVGRMN